MSRRSRRSRRTCSSPVSRLRRVFWTVPVGFPGIFRIFGIVGILGVLGILGGVPTFGLWTGWSGDLFAAAERGNPAARLLPGELAHERWDLTARFDSGHFLFAEFLITNFGLGDRNAAVIGHVVRPNGQSRRFRNGRRESRWQLSSDRLRMEVGSSLLDQRSPKHQLRVRKKSTQIELDFYPRGPAVWAADFPPSGYALDLLDPAARAEGSVWVKGMDKPVTVHGTVAVTHSWANEAESDLVLRRLEFFLFPDKQSEMSLYLADLTTPHGAHSSWLVAKNGQQVVHEAQNFHLTFDGNVKNIGSYHVPQQFSFESTAAHPHIKGRVQLDRVLLLYNPLDDIPQPFRFLISLKLKPRRVWLLSPFEIIFQPDQTRAPITLTGTGITKVSFLNPLAPPRPDVTVSLFQGFCATGPFKQLPGWS